MSNSPAESAASDTAQDITLWRPWGETRLSLLTAVFVGGTVNLVTSFSWNWTHLLACLLLAASVVFIALYAHLKASIERRIAWQLEDKGLTWQSHFGESLVVQRSAYRDIKRKACALQLACLLCLGLAISLSAYSQWHQAKEQRAEQQARDKREKDIRIALEDIRRDVIAVKDALAAKALQEHEDAEPGPTTPVVAPQPVSGDDPTQAPSLSDQSH